MPATGNITRVVLARVALGHLALPIYFWEGGMIETETTHFARQYLDTRSLLQTGTSFTQKS